MTASYTVTPLEGITKALEGTGIQIKYSAGAYGHRELPMLDGWVQTGSGESGFQADFYNEDPSNGKLVDSLTLPSARIRVNDSKPVGKLEQVNTLRRVSLTGIF